MALNDDGSLPASPAGLQPPPTIEIIFRNAERFAVIAGETNGTSWCFEIPLWRSMYCEPIDMISTIYVDAIQGKIGAEGPSETQLKHWRHHGIVGKPGQCEWCPPLARKSERPVYQVHNSFAGGGKVQVRRLNASGPEGAKITSPKVSSEDLGF